MPRDQHVAWLDVAMNDPLLMGVLDGLADLYEQFQPRLYGQLVLVAILGNWDTANQLHDEIWPARIGRSGIEHSGDIWMVHHRHGLAFGLEAGDNLLGVHPQLDDLQRHAAANRLLLLGHVHDAHAPFADLLQQLIGTDQRARAFGQWRGGNVVNRRELLRPNCPESCRGLRGP